MPQAAFPTPWKAKNAENHSSLVSEMQKLPKTAFRLQATSEKRQKYHFSRGGKSKTGKFCVSAAADEPKTPKIDFRPWPTGEKQ